MVRSPVSLSKSQTESLCEWRFCICLSLVPPKTDRIPRLSRPFCTTGARLTEFLRRRIPRMLLIKNGRVLDPAFKTDAPMDVLLDGDMIKEVFAPGKFAAIQDAEVLDA